MRLRLSHRTYVLEQQLLFIILLLLLFFDTNFSKFNVAGPLYLHDLCLVLVFIISLTSIRLKFRFKSFIWFILFGLAYLVYSFIYNEREYILRQYALFIYPTLTYLIFNKFYERNYLNVKFLVLIAKLSIWAQLIFFFLSQLGIVQEETIYVRVSNVAVLGIIVYCAYTLIAQQNLIKKVFSLGIAFVAALTLGQASVFLSLLTCIFVYLMIIVKRGQSMVIILLGVVGVLLLVLISSEFSDPNARWRQDYWEIAMSSVFLENFTFGNGFGVPYVNDDNINYFIRTYGHDNGFLATPEERYMKAMHNSFITIAFHVGILPLLLLIKPYYLFLKRSLSKTLTNRNTLFLGISLLGLTPWIGLNVILELPHSAVYFWLVYLTLYQALEDDKGKQEA